jgi:hypothetical protein
MEKLAIAQPMMLRHHCWRGENSVPDHGGRRPPFPGPLGSRMVWDNGNDRRAPAFLT